MKARECLFRETMEQDSAELWDGRLWQPMAMQRTGRLGEEGLSQLKRHPKKGERAPNVLGSMGPLKVISCSTWASCSECCWLHYA